jgi:hypothetical protein
MVRSKPEHPGDPGPDGFLSITVSAILDQSPESVDAADDDDSKQVRIHVPPMLL